MTIDVPLWLVMGFLAWYVLDLIKESVLVVQRRKLRAEVEKLQEPQKTRVKEILGDELKDT